MNGFWKIRAQGITPRAAGHGNMASSSSAMCISPMGIINAGNPRQAALETYDVASPIHHNYCRDAACCLAAAVAAALHLDASIDSVLKASVDYVPQNSANTMRTYITKTLRVAREANDYELFREVYYEKHMIPGIASPDSRETVPVALALFFLAQGDPQQTIIYGANFGRDADTIASMAGALAGALSGVARFPALWLDKVKSESPRNHKDVAQRLHQIIQKRLHDARQWMQQIQQLM
jgi:ADP-ribosylglycohydrolase